MFYRAHRFIRTDIRFIKSNTPLLSVDVCFVSDGMKNFMDFRRVKKVSSYY